MAGWIDRSLVTGVVASYDSRHVHVVCLSNGNGDGLGSVREQEMLECCVKEHGMLKENVRVLNHSVRIFYMFYAVVMLRG